MLRGMLKLYSRGANALTVTRAAPYYARYTVRYHLSAELLIGLFAGVMMLADLISRKTLGAPRWMVAVQSSVPVMTFILAMVWRDLLQGRDRGRVLLVTGLLGKGMLVAVAFIASPGPFLAVLIVFALMDSAFIPLRNTIFRTNYDRDIRGRIFGRVVSLMNLALVGSNLLAAYLLDHWSWTYRVLFPVAGLLGFGAHAIYARVKLKGQSSAEAEPRPVRSALGSLRRAFGTTVRILKEDRAFRAYERNFFLYGLAFLMNLPLVVLLITDVLNLEYGAASWARFVAPQILMILFSPIAGRIMDRTHPATMMAAGSGLLAIHAALLCFADGFWVLFASYCFFGVAMTAINLSWNLGPVHFAQTEREATDYMAVHVTLTGLRGLFGPALAIGALEVFGLPAGFAVSSGLYILSAGLMLRLGRAERRPADAALDAHAG